MTRREKIEKQINTLIKVMTGLSIAAAVVLVALLVFAAVSIGTGLAQTDSDLFLIVNIVLGFLVIGLVLALIAVLVAARLRLYKLKKLSDAEEASAKDKGFSE